MKRETEFKRKVRYNPMEHSFVYGAIVLAFFLLILSSIVGVSVIIRGELPTRGLEFAQTMFGIMLGVGVFIVIGWIVEYFVVRKFRWVRVR